MKKIPYGISDYRKLQEGNYLYVDKTTYLSTLENIGDTLMYLRPGRFGKSLFTSMMYYYYDINSEYLFESLFKSTSVYNNPTPNKNNYYVLTFDFSGLETSDANNKELKDKFKDKVIGGIRHFINYYNIKYEINEEKDSAIIIGSFLIEMSRVLNKKIYVIIDEYDNFTNAILEGDMNRFKSVVGNEGTVKAFYATIKEHCKTGIVDRFFATGICPITLNSMTTGFNIATDLSTDIRFNSMIGLTHNEVKELLNEYENKENMYAIMLENYDGYLFNKNLTKEDRTFNATLVMYFLKNYNDFNLMPEQLYDNNIVVNYGKIENLIKLQNNTFYKELIEELLKSGEISGSLRSQFNLSVDFDRNDVISLLYYFGYLTIKKEIVRGNLIFKIPNRMMKETYNNYFIKILKDINICLDNNKLNESVLEIINEGKIEKISQYVSEILSLSDNRIFMKFDEKYIQALYFGLLVGTKEYKVYSEYPTKNGYVDIMLISHSEIMENNIMIELKYIKKSEYSKELLNKKCIEGKEQLSIYSEDERINKHLIKYLVVFVGNEVKVLEKL